MVAAGWDWVFAEADLGALLDHFGSQLRADPVLRMNKAIFDQSVELIGTAGTVLHFGNETSETFGVLVVMSAAGLARLNFIHTIFAV